MEEVAMCENCGTVIEDSEVKKCEFCGTDGLGNCCIACDDHGCSMKSHER